jgi:putative tryptophan/tyrosine transport system substrate-binding protein
MNSDFPVANPGEREGRSASLEAVDRQRRAALTGIGLGVFFIATSAWSQSSAVKRVGILAPSTRVKEEIILAPFFAEMRRLGWVEGQNIAYDWALGADQEQALPGLAASLVARKPDLIYTPPASAAVAARGATSSIPIVFATGTDPVGTGLAQSIRRPGGNATGVMSVAESLAPKIAQMLREAKPDLNVIGYLGNPEDPRWKIDGDALAQLPGSMGLSLVRAPVAGPGQMDLAVGTLVRQGAQAMITGSSVTFNLRDQLVQLTRRYRIPVGAHRSEMADAGALLSYGAFLQDQIRLSGRLVDRVLRGELPGDIPIEQPNKFELIVNSKVARDLGLTIPSSLLLRADRVI